jgi:hypothetical protein
VLRREGIASEDYCGLLEPDDRQAAAWLAGSTGDLSTTEFLRCGEDEGGDDADKPPPKYDTETTNAQAKPLVLDRAPAIVLVVESQQRLCSWCLRPLYWWSMRCGMRASCG